MREAPPFTFPAAALAHHSAVLGKTGSGKTTTAKKMVEQVVPEGARVCVLDPIKSDWWGLTSNKDGSAPGLPFHVLGGPRAHVPLHESSGKAIGELVATGALPLSILDMADFRAGGLSEFFVAFADALMKHMRGVLYLVMEEAHEFAPKERSGIGSESMAIHFAKKLATAGRSKGIRLIVATQRTQALHNALLGSCETMIVHRMTAPADQAPVVAWLKANVDKPVREQVEASLSSLPTGTGWICSGEAKLFERVAFPRITTFDNSRTPTEADQAIDVKTAPVDRDKLVAIIGDAVAKAEADDPKLLKKRIAELECEVAGKGIAKPAPVVDRAALEAAGRERHADGRAQGYAEGLAAGADIARKAFAAASGTFDNELHGFLRDAAEAAPVASPSPAAQPARVAPPRGHSSVQAAARSIPGLKSPHADALLVPGSDANLTGPQRHLLSALAWWKAMGHDEPTRVQLAAKAGWTPKGSNLRNRLSELSSAGMVSYPRDGLVRLTGLGLGAAPSPDLNQTLVDSIRAILTGPQRTIFDTLYDFRGDAMTRAAIAGHVGWEAGGSNLRNRLSELSSLELVEYPAKGEVALQDWVLG